MPLRRPALITLAVTTLSALTGLAALPTTGAAALPLPVPAAEDALAPVPPAKEDRLKVTVDGSGDRALDGTFTLDCHPEGGTHGDKKAACERLDEVTRWGKDPFAPVAPDAKCTMIYGGPATARLTGTWAGRPVDARFSRKNGCEIARWDNLRPVLPEATG